MVRVEQPIGAPIRQPFTQADSQPPGGREGGREGTLGEYAFYAERGQVGSLIGIGASGAIHGTGGGEGAGFGEREG